MLDTPPCRGMVAERTTVQALLRVEPQALVSDGGVGKSGSIPSLGGVSVIPGRVLPLRPRVEDGRVLGSPCFEVRRNVGGADAARVDATGTSNTSTV